MNIKDEKRKEELESAIKWTKYLLSQGMYCKDETLRFFLENYRKELKLLNMKKDRLNEY